MDKKVKRHGYEKEAVILDAKEKKQITFNDVDEALDFAKRTSTPATIIAGAETVVPEDVAAYAAEVGVETSSAMWSNKTCEIAILQRPVCCKFQFLLFN